MHAPGKGKREEREGSKRQPFPASRDHSLLLWTSLFHGLTACCWNPFGYGSLSYWWTINSIIPERHPVHHQKTTCERAQASGISTTLVSISWLIRICFRSRVVPKEIMIKNQLLAQTRRRKRSKKSANSCKKMLHSVVPVLKKNNILIHIRHNFHENYKPKNRSYKKTKRKRFFEKIKRRMDSCDFSFSQVL